ncbi:MAG: plastocyanin/azurin family copper-binding protein [Balneolaceae bacterium]
MLALALCFLACCTSRQPVTHYVEIKQMQFVPAILEVAQGDSVIWTNKDIVEHNVVNESKPGWESKSLKMGEMYALKIEGKDIDYLCTLHPVMKGRIVISQNK